jgi:hypothetical protein
MEAIAAAERIMRRYAADTGLDDASRPPRRYLWTDAYGVCTFLGLYGQTGNAGWRRLALTLVDQVHQVLGRHRPDDSRSGWISGLDEAAGRRRPTAGGLRIGKRLNERGPGAPVDERMEWDRDGQYFHYLTKWMHALDCVARTTRDATYLRWALDLARAAHAGFVTVRADGSRHMCWKMSTDLSYPQVPSMGHHDPLDGFVTFRQLQTSCGVLGTEEVPAIQGAVDDMAELCAGRNWITEDPLGIGGLLGDAYRLLQMIRDGGLNDSGMLAEVLGDARQGLEIFAGHRLLQRPADQRLAFRELGLAIGLHAVARMSEALTDRRNRFENPEGLAVALERLGRHAPLRDAIERFWREPSHREARSWTEHRDINRVMLATSLCPDGFLRLSNGVFDTH